MKSFKTVIVEKNSIDRIFCDSCGAEIQKDSFGNFFDYFHFEKHWGYLSKKDGTEHSFDICENCYDNIISGFKNKK